MKSVEKMMRKPEMSRQDWYDVVKDEIHTDLYSDMFADQLSSVHNGQRRSHGHIATPLTKSVQQAKRAALCLLKLNRAPLSCFRGQEGCGTMSLHAHLDTQR